MPGGELARRPALNKGKGKAKGGGKGKRKGKRVAFAGSQSPAIRYDASQPVAVGAQLPPAPAGKGKGKGQPPWKTGRRWRGRVNHPPQGKSVRGRG